MNNQTKRYRKLGLSRKVIKGASHPDNSHRGYAVDAPFEVFKGKACITAFAAKERNPENKRKSAWQGAGKRPARAIEI